MVLTITQFVEALFIAALLIVATSPQLLAHASSAQQALQLFHFF